MINENEINLLRNLINLHENGAKLSAKLFINGQQEGPEGLIDNVALRYVDVGIAGKVLNFTAETRGEYGLLFDKLITDIDIVMCLSGTMYTIGTFSHKYDKNTDYVTSVDSYEKVLIINLI